jgi:HPr kinase/phosphorylase
MNEHNLPKETVMLDKFASELNLEILHAGRGMVTLKNISVDRPGLRLAGFANVYDADRIMLIGLAEHEYMRSFSEEERASRISFLFEGGTVPCVIFARDLPVLPEFLECARKSGTPLFRTSKVTTSIMADIYVYLNRLLAPDTTVHGVLMDVFGAGILLTGNSGVGKSETAMELIKRGHRLVADDSVLIKRVENELIGTAPERIRYFMELRGIGIINVKNMYGSGSVLTEKQVELVFEMENWRRDKEYDRIGGESNFEEILGIKVPKLIVPVSPGRNLAILIEVAARDQRLKSMGYDAAQELIQRTIGR